MSNNTTTNKTIKAWFTEFVDGVMVVHLEPVLNRPLEISYQITKKSK